MTWADTHYRTFDGHYYAIQGNCTYILFQEIIPKYNISVDVKNYYCDPIKHLACPEYVIVKYKSYNITLASDKNKVVHVYVNDEEKNPTYITDNIIITTTDIKVTLNISEINTQIIVSDSYIQIRLPFSYFHNNTRGSCGYCGNSTINECSFPNGTINQTCENMQKFSMVPPDCEITRPTPTYPTPTTPPNICEIFKTNVFNSCHNAVAYWEYYEACKLDVFNRNESFACASMEAYAHLCGQNSICVDWRSSLVPKGLCELKCPSPKIYKACGPEVEKSCSTSYNDMYTEKECHSSDCNQTVVEGCYCPDGQYRVNMTSDKCTSYCDCIGPDGLPRKPGDTWTFECFSYKCVNPGITLKELVKCPTEMPCPDGYIKTVVNCCPTCVCDLEQCLMKKCDVGFQLALNKTASSCSCMPKDVCVYNNTEFKVGEVRRYTCETITCRQINGSFVTEKSSKKCTFLGQIDCKLGSEYVKQEEECCGRCVPKNCTYTEDNNTYMMRVGEVRMHKCENVTCREIDGSPVTEKSTEKCTYTSSRDCKPGSEYVKQEEKCCGRCVPKNCTYTADNTTYIIRVGEVRMHKCENVTCREIDGSPVTEKSTEKCTYTSSRDCKPGSEYVKQEEKCCGRCVPKNCTYTADNTTYIIRVGEVLIQKCENVTCREIDGSPVTEKSTEKCTYTSSRDCKPGSEYVKQEEKCCGRCIPKNCTYTADNTTYIMRVGEVRIQTCENVTCREIDGSPVTEKSTEKCTYTSSHDCKPGSEYVKQEEKCCGRCVPKNCSYTEDNNIYMMRVGEVRMHKCENVTCREIDGSPVTEKSTEKCTYTSSRDCKPGSEYVKQEEECCGRCIPKNCTYTEDNNTYMIRVGEVRMHKCENVTCREIDGLPVTEKITEKCTYTSSRDCKPCFEYVKEEKECCGTCKQYCCIYDAPDKTTPNLKVQEAYKFKCTTGTCKEVNGSLAIVESIKTCPYLNPNDCVPGTLKDDTDGCCQTCEHLSCVPEKNITRLDVNDCTSFNDKEVKSCTGNCECVNRCIRCK
ncbi:intestinal mucin-like protein [Carassius carassius]|uniref:intestinal mucin-like protein n=1 Tax=Carassius carassius TaxID=217509 RepID=UPI0028689394|nr:intestinal mucin-like protein [Carassius carassius]